MSLVTGNHSGGLVEKYSEARVVLVGYEDQDNLGLRYLSSRLKLAGHSCRIVKINGGPGPVLQAVHEMDPHIVGFSLIFQYLVNDFSRLLCDLRRAGVRAHFTMGGHYASFEYEDLMAAIPELDTVVRFEGEDTLLELAECISQDRSWEKVQGIAFRRHNGISLTEVRSGRADLDELPWPDREDIDYESRPLATASVLGSRGCPWKCSFCSIITFYDANGTKGRRRRNPGKIVDELEYLAGRGVRVVLWQDDDFLAGGPSTIRWAHEIAQLSVKRGLHRKLRWKFSCRSNEVCPETLKPLVDAGLTHVYLGVEAGDPDDLRNLNKLLKPEVHLHAGQVMRALGISFDFGFMLMNPWSTFQTVRNNMAFLREFVGDGASIVGFCRMLPYVGTQAASRLIAEGRLVKRDLDADYRFLDPRLDRYYEWLIDTFADRNFSSSGTQNLLRLMLFECHLRLPSSSPNPTFREMVKCIAALDNRIVLETLETALEYFESNPDGTLKDETPRRLKEHHCKQDALIRRDLALLMERDTTSWERLHLTR